MRVGYLVTQYPALSHAFIEREVAALRSAGVEVDTHSVRPCPPGDLHSAAMRDDAATTAVLLGSPAGDWLRAHGRLLAGHPGAWLAGLGAAVRAGRGGVRGRVWQVFYFGEAVLLSARLGRRGIRHLHVHFANNGADVARLATTIGNAARRAGDPAWTWSFTMHGPTEFTDPAAHDLAGKTAAATFVACISRYARQRLRELAPAVQEDRLPIVRMGVDVDRFPPAAEDRAARPAGPLRVLFVGRLVPEKAPEDLIRAAALATAPLTVTVIGQGPLRADLERLVDELGLADRVELVGPVGQDELPARYAAADVFCLPSHAEGVPVVLMEAMATELPVVTTRIAGIPELVDDGESGVLVEPGDPGAVAAALDGLATDPGRRRRLGRAGRAMVCRDYTAAPNARLLAERFAAPSSLVG